jgi:hypothetical protein
LEQRHPHNVDGVSVAIGGARLALSSLRHGLMYGSFAWTREMEYLWRAEECRKLVQQTPIPDHRKAIQKICDMWLRLADERRKLLEQPDANGSPNRG